MSAKQKILKYLKKHNALTTKQAMSYFKIINVSARVSELRNDGYMIQAKTRVRKDGQRVNFYSMV